MFGDIMKSKITQIILIAFIVFMLFGIINSLSEAPSEDVSIITSEFESLSEYNTEGYITYDPFNEENINSIARFNGKIGTFIATLIKKIINFFFELIKKAIS